MREVTFQKKNADRWKEIDKAINGKSTLTGDELASIYVQLNDDLAYAQTNFPNSNTAKYLNQLLLRSHQDIYSNKSYSKNSLVRFFTHGFPFLIYKYRKAMWLSFAIFFVSCLIGAFSSSVDEEFPRLILGDQYVDMTLSNIEKGKPLGVYDNQDELGMFAGITFNNVRVSFTVFIGGLLACLGTVYALFNNGVMLGSFQYFFYQKGFLGISLLTIWVHGTLEITAIVIAGGAGMALGNSWMYPGTYSRLKNLQRTAVDVVKIIAGLIPIFIMAGFLEGFATRHAQLSPIPAATIITLSILFVVFYFIIYPYRLRNEQQPN